MKNLDLNLYTLSRIGKVSLKTGDPVGEVEEKAKHLGALMLAMGHLNFREPPDSMPEEERKERLQNLEEIKALTQVFVKKAEDWRYLIGEFEE